MGAALQRSHPDDRTGRVSADRYEGELMDWVNLPIAQGGFAVIVFGVMVSVISGRLVPRSWVDEIRKGDQLTIERQQEEIREWRTAFITAEKANRELRSHIPDMTETAPGARDLVKAEAGQDAEPRTG